MAKILFLIQNFVDTFSIIFLTYTDVRMFSFFSSQYLEKKRKINKATAEEEFQKYNYKILFETCIWDKNL
jgi:hypothetical protein